MRNKDLVLIAENMWGNEAQIRETKIKGIYEAITPRHGGYLVDINIHSKLKNYGSKTEDLHIRAFEEDYEALKVLWVYPQLIKNPYRSEEWLNEENLMKYESNSNFLKDFPRKNIIENEEKDNEYEQIY